MKISVGFLRTSRKIVRSKSLLISSFLSFANSRMIALGIFSKFAGPFFTDGAKGMITLNQICLIKHQLEGLEINKLYGTELWPIELIKIQQIE